MEDTIENEWMELLSRSWYLSNAQNCILYVGFLVTLVHSFMKEAWFPFYRWENWGSEKFKNLTKDLQMVSDKGGIQNQTFLSLHIHMTLGNMTTTWLVTAQTRCSKTEGMWRRKWLQSRIRKFLSRDGIWKPQGMVKILKGRSTPDGGHRKS